MSTSVPAVSTRSLIVIKFGGTCARHRQPDPCRGATSAGGRTPGTPSHRCGERHRPVHRPAAPPASRGGCRVRVHTRPFVGRPIGRWAPARTSPPPCSRPALLALGLPAVSLRGGRRDLAVGEFGAAVPVRLARGPIEALLGRGEIPVVSGFQAIREDGELVTLGRGGWICPRCSLPPNLARSSAAS